MLHYGHPARLPAFEKALAVFVSVHAAAKEIETLSDANVEYFITGRHEVAERTIRRIIKLQQEIGFRQQQYAYDVLTYLNYRKGDLTNALIYSNKTLRSLHSKTDSVFISFFYTRRGILYSYLIKYAEAMSWFDKSLEKRTSDTRLYWYKSFLGKASTLIILGKGKEAFQLLQETGTEFPPADIFEKMHFALLLGESYAILKNPPLAKKNYKIFLALAEKFPIAYIHDEFPDAFLHISDFYLSIGELQKARKFLGRAKTYTSKLDMMRTWRYYEKLYRLDSIENKYTEAITDLKLSHRYADSVFSYDQQKKVSELLLKYESKKKDDAIELLNSRNQLQQVRADRTKNITLGVLSLLLIIISFLFNRYITKQRNNRKLEAHQKELDQKNVFLETLNLELEKLLKEKEWLVREVHHRVKNNLQIVTSLLYSQSEYLEDNTAKLAIEDSLRRMQAMSLIHKKLYRDENTSTIDMPEYVNDLVHYLQESFEAENGISFIQSVEPLQLDVSQAIPIGLIITESIVNAIKYAFLKGENGIVTVELRQDGPDHLLLKITDNGIGLPDGLDIVQHDSLGLELIRGLSKQLMGNLSIENDHGVHITIRFSVLNR